MIMCSIQLLKNHHKKYVPVDPHDLLSICTRKQPNTIISLWSFSHVQHSTNKEGNLKKEEKTTTNAIINLNKILEQYLICTKGLIINNNKKSWSMITDLLWRHTRSLDPFHIYKIFAVKIQEFSWFFGFHCLYMDLSIILCDLLFSTGLLVYCMHGTSIFKTV